MIARLRAAKVHMARAFVPLFALVAVFALVASIAFGLGATTRAAQEDLAAPAGPPAGLPDLTIQYMQVTLETGGACNYSSTTLGLRVYFANIGDADAGPFDIDVNSTGYTYGDGLPAGEKGTTWVENYVYGGINKVAVDVEEEIVESDETNNHLEEHLAIPTLPPTCTPTPSVTPTPTVTSDRPEILGDVDCDFAITAIDALLVLQLVAGLIDELPCPDAADASLDGMTNAVDSAIILQIVAGLLGVF